jgi:hypothetical protein
MARDGRRGALLVNCGLILVLGLVGCSQDGSENPPDDGEEPVATLEDAGGLVGAFEFVFNLPDDGVPDYVRSENQIGDDQIWLAEGPSGWDYRIVWTALPCNTAPDIHVSGTEDYIDAITIVVGPIVSPDGDCEAMEARHAVNIRTVSPITEETKITLQA